MQQLFLVHDCEIGTCSAILVHKTLSFKEYKDLNILYREDFECIFIELYQKSNTPILIGLLYQPPNTRLKDFKDQYQKMINKLVSEKHM